MSAFRTVRVSKFRHVYGQPARRENCYEGIRITASAHDSQFCAVNPKFIAVVVEVAGGGAFQVLPIKWTGKVDYHTGRISGHSGVVNDIKWNPFNDNVIASCSDDATIKLWYVPDEGVKTLTTHWLCELIGHSRRVAYIEWHPTTEGVLASAGFDFRLFLWNVSRGECLVAIDCHEDIIYSMAFNWNGSLLATTCKDKLLRIIDARSGRVLQETCCHEGTKASKVVFLGDKRKLLTTGFSRVSHRQYAVWDLNELSEPLMVQEIDTSAGVLFPFYDSDLGVAYIAGKGDGNIRYYEILDSKPYIQSLSEYQSKYPQRGMGFMPKRGLNVTQCEIFRFYKVHNTQALVEPLSFIVPRKSDCFQSDLYPATAGPTPALTVDEWLCGIDKEPIRISLRVDFVPTTNKPVQVKMASTCEGGEVQPLLITSDRNNERKFQFLSEVVKPDYRDITQREDYPDLIKNEQFRINLSERLRLRQAAPIARGGSSSSGDSPQRISAGGGVDESLDEDEEKEETSLDVYLSESNSTSAGATASNPIIVRPLKQFAAVSPRQSPSVSSTTSTQCLLLASPKSLNKEHSSTSIPSKVRRISQNSARSSPPLQELQLDALSNDSSVGGSSSLLDRSAVCAVMPFADQMSLGSMSFGSSSAQLSRSPAPLLNVSGESHDPNLPPRLLKPQIFQSNGHSDRKITKPGCIAPGPIVHRETTAHIRPFRISQSQPPTPRNMSSPDESSGGNRKETEVQKLYAQQSKRLRELMEELEPKDKRIVQLEQDLTKLTLKVEELQKDSHRKHEDIESLRYEIAWKNRRITQLEQQLYKHGSGARAESE